MTQHHKMNKEEIRQWEEAFTLAASEAEPLQITKRKAMDNEAWINSAIDSNGTDRSISFLRTALTIQSFMPVGVNNPVTSMSAYWTQRDIDYLNQTKDLKKSPSTLTANLKKEPDLIPQKVSWLLSMALHRKNIDHLRKIIDLGFKPDEGWRIDHSYVNERMHQKKDELFKAVDAEDKKGSLLWAALMSNNEKAFNIFMKMPTIVEEAKRTANSPWAFEALPIKNLLMMRKRGISIEGVDQEGNNMCHLWAMLDDQPRVGWASLVKACPELVNQKNLKGQLPFELALKNKTKEEQRQFQKLISQLEKESIKKVVKKTVPVTGKTNRIRL